MTTDDTLWECPECAHMNPEDGNESPCSECGGEYFDPMKEEAGDLQHGDTISIGINDLEGYVVGRTSAVFDDEVMLVLIVKSRTKFRFISREIDGRDGVGRNLQNFPPVLEAHADYNDYNIDQAWQHD